MDPDEARALIAGLGSGEIARLPDAVARHATSISAAMSRIAAFGFCCGGNELPVRDREGGFERCRGLPWDADLGLYKDPSAGCSAFTEG